MHSYTYNPIKGEVMFTFIFLDFIFFFQIQIMSDFIFKIKFYKYIQSEHDLIAAVKNILFKNYLIQIGLSKYLSLLLFKHDFIITIT